jgi:ABC-type multidrug transport system fused ATPase/permease subunit
VFDGTIRDNLLASGSSNITSKEINQALKDAHCEFIYDFKDGIETEIGER